MTVRRVCRFRNGKTGETVARLCYEIDRSAADETMVKGVASIELRITVEMMRLYEQFAHLRRDGIDFILTMHDPAIDGEWFCSDDPDDGKSRCN